MRKNSAACLLEMLQAVCLKKLLRDFSQEAGELTPTMKIKRKTVEDVHCALFDSIYSDAGTAIEIN